jgi:hypothetical protein
MLLRSIKVKGTATAQWAEPRWEAAIMETTFRLSSIS